MAERVPQMGRVDVVLMGDGLVESLIAQHNGQPYPAYTQDPSRVTVTARRMHAP